LKTLADFGRGPATNPSNKETCQMKRRTLLAGGTAIAASGLGRRTAAQRAKSNVLRFVPASDLGNPDPVWTTAGGAATHGYMVWDNLFGIDETLTARPQMLAGYDRSADELTWTFTLRDGLKFHDNEPVRAIDCTTSIGRWAVKNPLGQTLADRTQEMKPLDDKRFQIRLKKRFRQMTYAMGAGNLFVMPERMAKTPASEPIKEYVGSGPFVFKRDEWVSGASAAYEKFKDYVPRAEKPNYYSGGKVANFDRVEWIVQPDPSTAAAALQANEVDWLEAPLLDMLPTFSRAPGCKVVNIDPFGSLAMLTFNHLHPPFDNAKLLRALLPAIDQQDFVRAWVGDLQDYGRYPVGFFTAGTPMASDAGMEAFSTPRDLAKARQLIGEAGYRNEKIVFMVPHDLPEILALSQVARDLLVKLGMNIDFQMMDWGTLVARRAKQDPLDKGGWSAFCTTWQGLPVANPGNSFPLRANGRQAWFGWPTDPKIEALRDEWLDAPDVATQKTICEQIQLQAFESIPFMPLGQWYYPRAVRSDLTDFVRCEDVLFWGVRRV
jgi:peptide/nickel transport system substrate-binding protein